MKGVPLLPVFVDDVKETALTVIFVAWSMLTRFDVSCGGIFRRRLLRRVVLAHDGFSVFFHTNEVVRTSNGILQRRGGASIEIFSELTFHKEIVPQGIDGDVVWDIDS